MSLVDPQRRWWRRESVLKIVVPIGWVIAAIAVVVAGWANTLYFDTGVWTSWAGAEWFVGADDASDWLLQVAEISTSAVLGMLFGVFALDVFYRIVIERGYGWPVAHLFGTALLGIGIGWGIAVFPALNRLWLPVLMTVLGAAMFAIRPVVVRQARIHKDRQEWSRMNGVPVVAVVTKTGMITINGRHRWTAVLKFTDNHGRDRWHRASIPVASNRQPVVGDRFELRFDPAKPGRRSSIYVSLATPATNKNSRWKPMPPAKHRF